MKKLTILKFAASLFLLVGVLAACVEDNKYDTPQITCNEPDVTVNATIGEVKALYAGSVVHITSDMIIEGYVVSSDEAGNFYGSLHFQDALVDPTIGFQLDTNLPDLYTKYPAGSKIVINLNGLYLGDYNGVLKVGGLFDSYGSLKVGRLSADKTSKAIYLACDENADVIPNIVSIGALNDSMINTLIKFENVEMGPASLCQTYAVGGQSKPTSVTLQDCNGDEIILSNSGFADFQADLVPAGKGTLVAVLSKYKGKYQLKIRSIQDVVMNDARCDGSTFSCEAPEANATIQDIKDVYAGDKALITEDLVVEGTVTANDVAGNLFKYIYIQDETGGLKIKIDQYSLYLRGYTLGQKVIVKAKGLKVDNYAGEIYLGGNGKYGIMEESVVYKHLFVGEENAPLEPKVLTIAGLTEEHVGLFVKFESLQFSEEGITFADKGSTDKRNTFLTDCSANGITVRTSGKATFAGTTLPTGNGAVYGIVNIFKGTFQLLLRDFADFSEMNDDKCDIYASAEMIDLSAVRAMFTGSKLSIENNVKIKAVITSDGATGNIHGQSAFAQDATGAIALRFAGTHDLEIGTEVVIALMGVDLKEYNGLLQLSNIPLGNIGATTTGTLPTPTVITLEQALSGNYESMLVTIEGVEFKDITKTFEGDNSVTDCTNELKVYVRGDATFKDSQVSVLKGAITGIMSEFNTPQMYIRDAADVVFADVYEACTPVDGGGEGEGEGSDGSATDLYISEYAEGSSSNKYIEIYNGTGAAIDLSNYQVWGANGGKGWDTNLNLTGTLADGAFLIIAADQANTEILDKATLALGYPSPVHFNGDDAIALSKKNDAGTYAIIDVIGTPDVDPGSGWEVAGVSAATKDHTIVRKTVTQGNADWAASSASEWEVKDKNDWSNLGIR
ncbi:MAG: hypothetical protein COB98_00705 [Flavobacteriaceae bacterium]|nr:MAG: hypothetical protein COB98_00705 [Flavobacteriaceae bacterium]